MAALGTLLVKREYKVPKGGKSTYQSNITHISLVMLPLGDTSSDKFSNQNI